MASGDQNLVMGREEFYREVGRRIATKRRDQNKTQEILANSVGLSRTSLVNIEKGAQRVLAHTMYEIASELRVPLTELLPSAPVLRSIERMDVVNRNLVLRAIPELGTRHDE